MKKVRRWYATGGVERQKITGEVFTPEHVGLDMLSLLMDHDPGLITGTFLDPSCGDGRFVALHRNSVGIEQDAVAGRVAVERAPGCLVHEGDFFAWATHTVERFDCATRNLAAHRP